MALIRFACGWMRGCDAWSKGTGGCVKDLSHIRSRDDGSLGSIREQRGHVHVFAGGLERFASDRIRDSHLA